MSSKANKAANKEVVTVTEAKAEEQIVIRPPATIRELLSFSEDGGSMRVKKGEQVSPDELSLYLVEEVNSHASRGIRVASALVYAKTLAPIGELSAFEYVKLKVSNDCDTPSEFQNLLGLVECVELRNKYSLTAGPYTIKETLGYLKKLGVLTKSGELPMHTPEGETIPRLKLENPILKLLASSDAKVNAIRTPLNEEKAKHKEHWPKLWEAAEAKRKLAEAEAIAKRQAEAKANEPKQEAKTEAGAEAGAESVNESATEGGEVTPPEVNAPKQEAKPEQKPEEQKPEAKTHDSAEAIAIDLRALVSRIDKIHARIGVNAARAVYESEFLALAKMAGYDCKLIQAKK